MKKNPSLEELMETFLKMIENDEEKVPHLIKFIKRVVFDTMDLGEKGYQPILSMTLFVKQDAHDKAEIIFRPIRISSQEIYNVFQLGKLGELVHNAFGQYAKEVFGMTPIDEKDEMRIDGKAALEQWGHLMPDKKKQN